MALYLINFAKGDLYKKVQHRQNELLRGFFKDIFEYDENFLIKEGYYERNKEVIDNSETGWGYCGWKGTIMLDAMSKIQDDDLLFYSDVADEIYNPAFFDWLILRTNQMGGKFFNLNYYIHGQWTKRDCFRVMGCDTEEYWNHRQLEAGTIGLLKQPDTIDLLEYWSMWCQFPRAIDKVNQYSQDNLPGFVDHRTDQSILTNLVIKRGWETERMENVRAYIKYNEFEKGMNLTKHQYGR